jgi:MerR family transcriptional regulator, copper efflux regulator
MAQSGLRIGEVAASSGVSIDTVRYYEKRRLLPRAPRTEGGFRLFAPETIERVQFIKQAQDIGLSLEEIGQLLATGGGANECLSMRDLLRAKLSEIDERMELMRKFRQTLARHLSACEKELQAHGEAASCPVVVEITHTSHASKAIRGKESKK